VSTITSRKAEAAATLAAFHHELATARLPRPQGASGCSAWPMPLRMSWPDSTARMRTRTTETGQDETYLCSTCGSTIAIFLGHGDGWHHYRGEGTVASPVELYDAGP